VTSFELLSKDLLVMELRFDVMLYYDLGTKILV